MERSIFTDSRYHLRGAKFLRKLGSGQYGIVVLCERNTHPFALKLSKASQISENEQQIMELLGSHPNIVPFYDAWCTKNLHILQMGYISGPTLLDLISVDPFPEPTARLFFRQLVAAMLYAHERCQVVHRDLKAENIMVQDAVRPVIIDWGMSAVWSPYARFSQDCGSPHYAAPEIFQKVPYLGPEIDVWSLGVILYAMVTSLFPFAARDPVEIAFYVVKGNYEAPAVSPQLCHLISRMLTVEPARRISLREVSAHPWLQSDAAQQRSLPRHSPLHGSAANDPSPLLSVPAAVLQHPVPQNQQFSPQNQSYLPQNQSFPTQNPSFPTQNQSYLPQNQSSPTQNQHFPTQKQQQPPQQQLKDDDEYNEAGPKDDEEYRRADESTSISSFSVLCSSPSFSSASDADPLPPASPSVTLTLSPLSLNPTPSYTSSSSSSSSTATAYTSSNFSSSSSSSNNNSSSSSSSSSNNHPPAFSEQPSPFAASFPKMTSSASPTILRSSSPKLTSSSSSSSSASASSSTGSISLATPSLPALRLASLRHSSKLVPSPRSQHIFDRQPNASPSPPLHRSSRRRRAATAATKKLKSPMSSTLPNLAAHPACPQPARGSPKASPSKSPTKSSRRLSNVAGVIAASPKPVKMPRYPGTSEVPPSAPRNRYRAQRTAVSGPVGPSQDVFQLPLSAQGPFSAREAAQLPQEGGALLHGVAVPVAKRRPHRKQRAGHSRRNYMDDSDVQQQQEKQEKQEQMHAPILSVPRRAMTAARTAMSGPVMMPSAPQQEDIVVELHPSAEVATRASRSLFGKFIGRLKRRSSIST